MRIILIIVAMTLSTLGTASRLSGAVTIYETRAAWEAAVQDYSTINFTELPENTWITNQYADLGVQFTDGSDQVYYNTNGFADGYGLNGAFDESTLEFNAPMSTLAMSFPGTLNIKLSWMGAIFYTGTVFGGSGYGHFVGVVSTQPFDEIFLYDPSGGLFVDNLYFGPPIPAPSVLGLLGIAVLFNRGRRR